MVKAWSAPSLTVTAPLGEMLPPPPAMAVMVWEAAKSAVTVRSAVTFASVRAAVVTPSLQMTKW